VGKRHHQEHETERGQPDAGPLPPADREAEAALRQDGQEDEAARDHGLHHGQRGERQRANVKPPSSGRHEHPDREPLRPEEPDRAPHRVLQAYIRSRAGAAVLEQEAHVRRERA
jgi:hypothetical protein